MERIVLSLSLCKFLLIVTYLSKCVSSSNNGADYIEERWKDDPFYFTKTIRMPNVTSPREDALLCHSVKIDERQAYIMKYEPHAHKEVAHHMMVYGCNNPGSTEAYWPCGEMDDLSDSSVCSDGERQIVFAWALDGTSRELPKDVGFRVGGTTRIKYIVIQLHYKDKFQAGRTDDSGVTLHMTYTQKPMQAGYYVMGNMGYIPPHVHNFHLEAACTYKKDYAMYPIGYRTHSHNLGVVTSGYRIRNGTWTEIGRMSPQLPQTFYNVSAPGIKIEKGDKLASRCTMSSDRDMPTSMGATNKDEMCNFYILYYTYYKKNLKIEYCFRNAQRFRWSQYLSNIPPTASSIEGLQPFNMSDPFLSAAKSHKRRHHTPKIM